jgi:4-carboxymuconolactone decarboxylase
MACASVELLTFSMLGALGGCEVQVKGHVAANLNVGNDRGRIIDVLIQLLPFIGYPRTLHALRVVDDVTASSANVIGHGFVGVRVEDPN